MATYDIPVPRGRVTLTADQVERAAKMMGGRCVVKAQIYAGGRGKAGGVKLVHHPEQAQELGKELFGKQAGDPADRSRRAAGAAYPGRGGGRYLRANSTSRSPSIARPPATASSPRRKGGWRSRRPRPEVTGKNPDAHHRSIHSGCAPIRHARLPSAWGSAAVLCEDCVELILNLYRCCLEKDCSLVEINPLVVTKAGWLMAMDAKITFDDNAIFRHREYPDMVDYSQLDPLEITAGKYDLAYIKLDGNIGCMVNGAGLAMATLDVLKECGGKPANFLDVGGGATREKVAEAFKIILQDPDVKGIFVNIFGGIMRCDVIAQGIIEAATEVHCPLPIVVRMDGSQVEEGETAARFGT